MQKYVIYTMISLVQSSLLSNEVPETIDNDISVVVYSYVWAAYLLLRINRIFLEMCTLLVTFSVCVYRYKKKVLD